MKDFAALVATLAAGSFLSLPLCTVHAAVRGELADHPNLLSSADQDASWQGSAEERSADDGLVAGRRRSQTPRSASAGLLSNRFSTLPKLLLAAGFAAAGVLTGSFLKKAFSPLDRAGEEALSPASRATLPGSFLPNNLVIGALLLMLIGSTFARPAKQTSHRAHGGRRGGAKTKFDVSFAFEGKYPVKLSEETLKAIDEPTLTALRSVLASNPERKMDGDVEQWTWGTRHGSCAEIIFAKGLDFEYRFYLPASLKNTAAHDAIRHALEDTVRAVALQDLQVSFGGKTYPLKLPKVTKENLDLTMHRLRIMLLAGPDVKVERNMTVLTWGNEKNSVKIFVQRGDDQYVLHIPKEAEIAKGDLTTGFREFVDKVMDLPATEVPAGKATADELSVLRERLTQALGEPGEASENLPEVKYFLGKKGMVGVIRDTATEDIRSVEMEHGDMKVYAFLPREKEQTFREKAADYVVFPTASRT